jgi:hypothetical protein
MARNRRHIRRASSSCSRPRSKYSIQPASLASRQNQPQGYFHAPLRPPIQPFPSVPHGDAVRSLSNFPSHQPTHPSAGYSDRASSLTSGTTSWLASCRGLSVYTPSTPTGSTDGDIGDPSGIPVPVEQQGLANTDLTLRGINGSDCKPGWDLGGVTPGIGLQSVDYPLDNGFRSPYDLDTLIQSPYQTFHATDGGQSDDLQWIFASNPPKTSPLLEPWNGYNRKHNYQSCPTNVVEEGPVFQHRHLFATNGQEPLYPTNQQFNGAHGTWSLAQPGYQAVQELGEVSSARSVWAYSEDEDLHGHTPGSVHSTSVASPISNTQVSTPKGGIRRGPLDAFGRENAREARERGACLRCYFMKEQCVLKGDSICERCRELFDKYRTWDLPCSPIWLDKRFKYMFPHVLLYQLRGDQIEACIKAYVVRLVPGPPINMSLTLGSGVSLPFEAVEFIHIGDNATRMLSFGLHEDGSTSPTELNSPPILPYMLDRDKIERCANHWVDRIIREPDSDFVENYFLEPHECWQKEMLAIICRYHQDHIQDLEGSGEGPYQTLRWALKMAALHHIMDRPLVVPEDEEEAFCRQLRYKAIDRTKWICPRLSNKIIKNMLLKVLHYATKRVFGDLLKMLRAKGHEGTEWDQAFCIVIICLFVVAKTQATLVQRAEVGRQNGDGSYLLDDARSGIYEMEAEVSTHLIGMFHHRFGTAKKGNGRGKTFNPLARDERERPNFESRLAESVRSVTAKYGMISPLHLR